MSKREYKVIVNRSALNSLSRHVAFLANVNETAAQELRITYLEAFKSLELMPQRCPVFKTKHSDKTYRRLIIGKYAAIFCIDESASTVEIEYVWDMRQNNVL